MTSEWFYAVNKKKIGPVSFALLKQLADAGQIESSTMVLQTATQKWLPASSVEGLFPAQPLPAEQERSTPAGQDPAGGDTSGQRQESSKVRLFYKRKGEEVGPLAASEFLQVLSRGEIGPADEVKVKGLTGWVPVGAVPGLLCGDNTAEPALRTMREEFDPSTEEGFASLGLAIRGDMVAVALMPPGSLRENYATHVMALAEAVADAAAESEMAEESPRQTKPVARKEKPPQQVPSTPKQKSPGLLGRVGGALGWLGSQVVEAIAQAGQNDKVSPGGYVGPAGRMNCGVCGMEIPRDAVKCAYCHENPSGGRRII